ncbi:MAG: type II toxin-antitoxin system HigB family toxin [Bacteroidetes bacterium]|nr:type II toxin-antitoxin system HigB family toxin [Bacteroidota bacterium]
MRVHLIKEQTIQEYAEHHARSRSSFTIWLGTLRYADWKEPGDIKKTFSSADLLGKSCNRVVFDIGGNNYRMICKYHFGEKEVHLFVCWLGTHAEYDEICKRNEQYKISNY